MKMFKIVFIYFIVYFINLIRLAHSFKKQESQIWEKLRKAYKKHFQGEINNL